MTTEKFTTPEVAERLKNMQALTTYDIADFYLYEVKMRGHSHPYWIATSTYAEAQLMALKIIGKNEETGCAEDFESVKTICGLMCGLYVDERLTLVNDDEYHEKSKNATNEEFKSFVSRGAKVTT